MSKQNRLQRTLEAARRRYGPARSGTAPRVTISRVTYGQSRLRRKYESVRARRHIAPLLTAPRVTVGRHTYGAPVIPSFAGAAMTVEIGSFCSIAANVMLLLRDGHNTAWVTTWQIREVFDLPGAYRDLPGSRRKTVIGNDVWLGRDAVILDGVTIGDGAVIAARAVVTNDVRPYAVVGGVPAKEISRRFTDEQVDALLELGWWNWPDEKIIREVDGLNGADIDEFLDRHRVSQQHRLPATAPIRTSATDHRDTDREYGAAESVMQEPALSVQP